MEVVTTAKNLSLSDEACKKLDAQRNGVESYSKIIERILPPAQYAGPQVIHGAWQDMEWTVHRWASEEWTQVLKDLEKIILRDASVRAFFPSQRTGIITKLGEVLSEIRDEIKMQDELDKDKNGGVQ